MPSHYGHGQSHSEEIVMCPAVVIEFSTRKRTNVKRVCELKAAYSISGLEDGIFAIARSKKELKKLMKSDADVVYYKNKGKLYLNENGEEKGWGAKKKGGLLAKFKGKPEHSAERFDGMKLFDDDVLTGHTDGDDGDTSIETMFTSRKAARKAAKNFGCKGAHQMGDYWMPCREHGTMETYKITQESYSGYEQASYDYSGQDGYDYSGY